MNPELLAQKDSNGRNLLQFAALHRRQRIFDLILHMRSANLMIWAVDNDGNSVLHIAAHISKEESSSMKPQIRLSKELRWFKEVEKKVPLELSRVRNSKGETRKDIFSADHKKLYEEAMDAAKEMAMSGMFVATLVAFIMCRAALTIPYDKTNPWFLPFILINAAALSLASASIIYFWYILSWSTQDIFSISPHRNVNVGLVFLSISVCAMVVAFVACLRAHLNSNVL